MGPTAEEKAPGKPAGNYFWTEGTRRSPLIPWTPPSQLLPATKTLVTHPESTGMSVWFGDIVLSCPLTSDLHSESSWTPTTQTGKPPTQNWFLKPKRKSQKERGKLQHQTKALISSDFRAEDESIYTNAVFGAAMQNGKPRAENNQRAQGWVFEGEESMPTKFQSEDFLLAGIKI